MIPQLPLDISFKESASLDGFVMGDNAHTLSSIRNCVRLQGERFLYLWGSKGSGKSHLLQAACSAGSQMGRRIAYLPLELTDQFTPEIMKNLGDLDMVCLDDVQLICGLKPWEEALFHLFNQLHDRQSHMVVSADRNHSELQIILPDLHSRLGGGLCHRLHPLKDQDKVQLLIIRAKERGLTLPLETAHFILKRTPRDIGSLLATLERLDLASLAAGRKLTIPFVKTLLDQD
ncbi:MAG: DnaA regulatory inactivator Hda [Gammaproteobacteria bacterium]|nr:DnaA regulatory inactivator Hda [Gammaproteobacteria bacterium]